MTESVGLPTVGPDGEASSMALFSVGQREYVNGYVVFVH